MSDLDGRTNGWTIKKTDTKTWGGSQLIRHYDTLWACIERELLRKEILQSVVFGQRSQGEKRLAG